MNKREQFAWAAYTPISMLDTAHLSQFDTHSNEDLQDLLLARAADPACDLIAVVNSWKLRSDQLLVLIASLPPDTLIDMFKYHVDTFILANEEARSAILSICYPHHCVELMRTCFAPVSTSEAQFVIAKCAHDSHLMRQLAQLLPTHTTLFEWIGWRASQRAAGSADPIMSQEPRFSRTWTRGLRRHQLFPPTLPTYFEDRDGSDESDNFLALPYELRERIARQTIGSARRVPESVIGNMSALAAHLDTLIHTSMDEMWHILIHTPDNKFDETLNLLRKYVEPGVSVSVRVRRLVILRAQSLATIYQTLDTDLIDAGQKYQIDKIYPHWQTRLVSQNPLLYKFSTLEERDLIVWRTTVPTRALITYLQQFWSLDSRARRQWILCSTLIEPENTAEMQLAFARVSPQRAQSILESEGETLPTNIRMQLLYKCFHLSPQITWPLTRQEEWIYSLLF